MPQLKAYHRPRNVEDALQLLSRDGVNTAILAGGTQLTPHRDELIDEVVDLQATGLDEIDHGAAQMTLGATVCLQAIVDDDEAPALLREMARREGPNTFRNQGTVGGTAITADPESEFLAALLVHEAVVTVQTPAGAHTMPLDDFLADVPAGLRDGILTTIILQTPGRTAHARVARTPADRPIVAAVARRDDDGDLHLALCGVAPRPVLADPDRLDTLTPPADFRGSSTYRQEMAQVLTGRVTQKLEIGD